MTMTLNRDTLELTQRALDRYARQRGLYPDTAREELLDLLDGAEEKRVDESGLAHYRIRRSVGGGVEVDLSAQVVREGAAQRGRRRQRPVGPDAVEATARWIVSAHWLVRQLRARREQLGLTQTEAAELAGWSQPSWSRLEAGRHPPTLDTLERACEVLQCRIVLLGLGRSPTMPEREA